MHWAAHGQTAAEVIRSEFPTVTDLECEFDLEVCDLGIIRFADPYVRSTVAFRHNSIAGGMRVAQYHRLAGMPDGCRS